LLPLHPASEETDVLKSVLMMVRVDKRAEFISNKICSGEKDHYLCIPVRKEREAGFKDWHIEGLERKEGLKK